MSALGRIRLIVTGDLERASIVASISRFFPRERAEWLKPRKVNCGTSARLAATNAPNKAMKALARAMVAEARFGEDGEPAQLVLAVDDLELHNFDQPNVVCAHFRAAVEAEIGQQATTERVRARLRERVRESCSFHLMAPLVEAYFFGDRAALVRAGCAADATPCLADPDVERFESTEPEWLSLCEADNRRRLALPTPEPWWRAERHPKRYLEWLISRNAERPGPHYDEVLGGVAAFESLDWPSVPAHPHAIAFATSMFEDIADFFGVPNPLRSEHPSPLTYPRRDVRRATLLLRNM